MVALRLPAVKLARSPRLHPPAAPLALPRHALAANDFAYIKSVVDSTGLVTIHVS
jgi:hypothetical protein